MGDSSQSWEPGAHRTALGKLDSLEGVLSRHLSWFEPLRGSSASKRLVSASFRGWSGLRVSLSIPYYLYLLGDGGT